MTKSSILPQQAVTKAGALAREQLLEAAGEVFAAKGFDGATSREICLRAGVNAAAVNYHFGGFQALYMATLVEAHRRAVWTEELKAIGVGQMPAEEKLTAVLGFMVRRMVKPIATSWEMRILSRELMSPTVAHTQFFATAIEPQRRMMRKIVADVLGCGPNDPVVGRTLLSIMSPCIFLATASRVALENFHPPMADPESEVDALVAHMKRFALAGIEAVIQARMIGPAA